MHFELKVTPQTKDLTNEEYDRMFDISYNGIMIYPINEDFPMPFDAAIYIKDGMFIIDGDLGQQGSHRGYAKVGIPLDKVMRYLKIDIDVHEEYIGEVRELLTAKGWM